MHLFWHYVIENKIETGDKERVYVCGGNFDNVDIECLTKAMTFEFRLEGEGLSHADISRKVS